MKSMMTRFVAAAAAIAIWYLVLPVQDVLAASKDLNLDLSDDPGVIQPPNMVSLFLRLLVSLVIIVGLAYVAVKVMRKNMKVLTKAESIRVLDHYAFSLNKGVYITYIAGKVYVLGVTDHNINLISEITDRQMADDLMARAIERENEPIIPPSLLERIFPGFQQKVSEKGSFNTHIQKQIKKLQAMVDSRGGRSREDDRDD